jgi:hypothetical protein
MKDKNRSPLSSDTSKRIRIKSPKTGTAACREYFFTFKKIEGFYFFVVVTVFQLDKSAELAHEALLVGQDDPAKRKELEEIWIERKGAAGQVLRSQRQFFFEILLVRHIENYLNYLASLLFEIFTKRPETLRSSEKVTVEEILQHSTINAIVRSMAENKVVQLSYLSFKDLANFFQERFSLTLANESETKTLIDAIETRNISVHNRCIVNHHYIDKTGDTTIPAGHQKKLTDDYLDKIVITLNQVTRKLDKNARNHLKLKGCRFNRKEPANPAKK